jgi:hypothetical protein
MWFPQPGGGGGALAASFKNLRDSIISGDLVLKKNLLQNCNNQITKILSPLYSWQVITSPGFNLLTTDPTFPVVVLLPPHKKFNGFAVAGGWIYDAYNNAYCLPVDAEHLKKVGYLKVVKPQGNEAQFESQDNSTIVESQTQTATQDNAKTEPKEQEDLEVCEGVKHFAVVLNHDWVTRMVKNEKEKEYAEQRRSSHAAHAANAQQSGAHYSNNNSRGASWGGGH